MLNKYFNYKPKFVPKTEEQKEKIREKLLKCFIFNTVSKKDLEIIVDAMEEKQFKANDVVIKQYEEGDCVYVVESGNLICSKQFVFFVINNTPKKNKDELPKFLKEYGPGEGFGELALLYNAPRAATITAKTDCALWSLDRTTFNFIIKDSAMYFSYIRNDKDVNVKNTKLLLKVYPYSQLWMNTKLLKLLIQSNLKNSQPEPQLLRRYFLLSLIFIGR